MYTTAQMFGVGKIIGNTYVHRLHLFDKKYSDIVKYGYILKLF